MTDKPVLALKRGPLLRRDSSLRDALATLRVDGWISKPLALLLATYSLSPMIVVPSGWVNYTLGFCCLHLALGYVANDLADWRHDVAAGDHRSAHQLGRGFLTLLAVALAAGTVLYLVGGWLLTGEPLPAIYGAVTVGVGFLYSFPPRLKGRGALGVLSSAYLQWVSPLVFLLLGPDVRVGGWPGVAAVAAVLTWLVSMGCHGAVRHQSRDHEFDLAHTRTFAVRYGRAAVRRAVVFSRAGVFACCAAVFIANPEPAGFQSAAVLACYSVYHLLYYKRLERD